MKKVLAFLLAIMLLAGSAAMAEEAEQELYYLRGWGIGGDTQGPVTGWVGDLWAEKGFQLEAIGDGTSVEQMQIMLASGDIPDVIRFSNWEDYETAVEAGYLLCLDDYLDKLPNTVKYAQAALDYTRDYHSAGTGKLYEAYRRLMSANLYIDDYSMNTPVDVLSKCRRLKRDQGLDLVIIDYLQLMTAGGSGRSNESRQVEVSEMSRSMKVYAKELGVPIILLSQMSRGVETRPDHTPKLSDLRESGAIEQDADMVMFLHRAGKYDPTIPDDLVQLIVGKNRNGETGEVELQWEGATTSFRECVPGEQRAERKEQPRPEYAAPSAEKEEEEEVFEREEAETDNGLMPFAKAAESAEDDAPFDHAESDVTESAAPDEAFTEAEEELGDEEYKDEYEDEEDEAEALEEEYEDEYDDDFEDGEEEGGDLPF